MVVNFDHKEEVASDIFTFWFRPEKPVHYIAGQFTQLYLPHAATDDRGDKRWFTLSSSPSDELVSITTKFSTERQSSFKQNLQALKPRSRLNLADPMGDFVLPKDASIPLLFIAAGMGITPMHSMVRYLMMMHEKRTIHLVYAVKKAEELAWRGMFASSDITFTPMVTGAATGWDGETGMLSSERVATWAGADPRQLVYLSGPEIMVEHFVEELPDLGVPKERLVTDYFPGYEAV